MNTSELFCINFNGVKGGVYRYRFYVVVDRMTDGSFIMEWLVYSSQLVNKSGEDILNATNACDAIRAGIDKYHELLEKYGEFLPKEFQP